MASMLVANIPRQVHFLVALKSMKRHVIGFLCRLSGCIPVDRQDDRAFTGQGAARISHHFTEEDHICPQPPHHHHHQRHHHNHYETSQPRTERLSSREDVRSRHNLGRSDSALADQGLKDLHSGKSEDHPSGLMITTPSHSHRNGNGEAGGGGEGNSSSSSSVGTTPGRISGSRTPVDANEKQDGEGKHEVRKEGSQGTISRTKEDDRDEGIHETHSRLSSDNHHKYKSSVGSPEGHLDREKEDHEKLPLTSTSALSQRGQSIPTTWPHDEKSEGTKPGEREGDSRSVSFPRDLPVHGPGNSVSEGAIAVGGQMTSTTPGLSPSVAMRSEGTSPFTRIGDREGRYHHHPSNVHSNGSSHIREGFQLRTMASSASSTSIQMSISILGEGTKFTCDVRPGHKIRLEGKDYTVLKVFSDTHLLAKPPSDMPIRTIGSSPVPTAPVSRCTSVPRVGSEPLIAGAWTDKERTPMLGKMIRAESARETGRILRHHAGGLVAGQLSIGETRRKKRGGGGEEDDDESSGSTSGGGWRPTDREASFSSKSSSSCGSSASFTYNTSGRQSQSYEGDGNMTGGDKLSADGRRQEDEEEEENTKAQQETQRGNGNEAGDLVKSEASKMEREEEEEHQEEKEDQGRVEGDKQQQRDEGTKLHSVIGERRAKDEELPRGIGELGEEGLRRRKGGGKKDGREDVQEEERKEDGEVVKRGDAKGWARGGEEERRDDSTRALHRHHHHHDHHKRRAHEKQRRSSIVSYHPYKILPKVDQREVYEAVSQSLVEGDCIGIFPEGGSHDRTTLLPLKAGVAIMALQGLAAGAEDVMIVPVGLIYHNPHKTQSRATIHIGDPIPVSRELAIEYQHDRRAATSRILTDVEKGLRSCIITAQDHETMSLIRLCCSLYPPERLRLSPEKFFNLNQLISKLFWRCADELG
ncbi:glycerol-3-phosphate acyltransferase, partial [Cystoisospora suis]